MTRIYVGAQASLEEPLSVGSDGTPADPEHVQGALRAGYFLTVCGGITPKELPVEEYGTFQWKADVKMRDGPLMDMIGGATGLAALKHSVVVCPIPTAEWWEVTEAGREFAKLDKYLQEIASGQALSLHGEELSRLRTEARTQTTQLTPLYRKLKHVPERITLETPLNEPGYSGGFAVFLR